MRIIRTVVWNRNQDDKGRMVAESGVCSFLKHHTSKRLSDSRIGVVFEITRRLQRLHALGRACRHLDDGVELACEALLVDAHRIDTVVQHRDVVHVRHAPVDVPRILEILGGLQGHSFRHACC